jgi:hypothetical protein
LLSHCIITVNYTSVCTRVSVLKAEILGLWILCAMRKNYEAAHLRKLQYINTITLLFATQQSQFTLTSASKMASSIISVIVIVFMMTFARTIPTSEEFGSGKYSFLQLVYSHLFLFYVEQTGFWYCVHESADCSSFLTDWPIFMKHDINTELPQLYFF